VILFDVASVLTHWSLVCLSVSVCAVDINECESDDACMYGTCVNVPGGYECLCDDDHQLIPSGTGCVG